MAKRRMLSIDFCESDEFYNLSPVSRMLYVHLMLNADDDGFVDNFRTVMRCARIEKRFYTPLVECGYIIEIRENLILIAHWLRHNTIRADRKVASAYAKELHNYFVDEEGRYTEGLDALVADICASQYRIEKNRKEKNRIEKMSGGKVSKSSSADNHSSIHTTAASQHEKKETKDISFSKNAADSSIRNKESLSEINTQTSDHTEKYSSEYLLNTEEEYSCDNQNKPVRELVKQNLKNAVTLYFMKRYRTIDISDFMDYYEKRDWMDDEGNVIVFNPEYYVDLWMQNKER